MIKGRVFGIFMAIVAFSMFFPAGWQSVHCAEVVDRVVAVVNADIITLQELEAALKPYADKIRESGYSAEKEKQMTFKVRGDVLGRLVDEKLTDQEIRRAKIKVSKNQVEQAIERIKEANYFTEEELVAALAREGLTLDELRRRTREKILRSRLVNYQIKSKIVVTDSDIAAYYETHRGEYAGEVSYHLKNIVLEIPPGATEEDKAAVLAKMETIKGMIAGGADFAEVAKAHSQSSLAAEGGELGFFKPAQLSPEIRKAVSGTPEGGLTPVLVTEFGAQLFQVVQIRQQAGKTLAEATPLISKKLYAEIVEKKFKSWLKDLKERSHIKIIQ